MADLRQIHNARRRSPHSPVQDFCFVKELAVLVQQGRVCLEYDDVVEHHGCTHDEHLQLIVDPQKHRAGDETQDTAVDEILTAEKHNHFYLLACANIMYIPLN